MTLGLAEARSRSSLLADGCLLQVCALSSPARQAACCLTCRLVERVRIPQASEAGSSPILIKPIRAKVNRLEMS